MKLTYESYKQKFVIETEDDGLSLDELIPLIVQLLLGAGFAQESIDQWIDVT